MEIQGITKKQSTSLQGLAILLMLYHHFFLAPESYGDTLSFFHIGRVSKLAWFGKICVAMFAFISGYGMCQVLKKKKSTVKGTSFFSFLVFEYKLVLGQILRLLIRVWPIFIVFMILVFQTGKREFIPEQYWKNFFFLQTDYNGAFWYVEQYMKMMLLLPLMDLFFCQPKHFLTKTKDQQTFRVHQCIFFGILFLVAIMLCITGKFFSPAIKTIILQLVSAVRPAFTAVFFVGFLIARFEIYEKITSVLQAIKKPGFFILGILLMLTVLYIRTRLAFAPAYAESDFILVPFWVYGYLCISSLCPPMDQFFYFFGLHSTYMWLTHVFIFDFTSVFFRAHLQSHLLFYVIQVVLSLLLAILLNALEKLLVTLYQKTFQSK